MECGITFQRTDGNVFMCNDCRDEAEAEGHVLMEDPLAADPVLLASLRDMGFGERDAKLALERTGNQNIEV